MFSHPPTGCLINVKHLEYIHRHTSTDKQPATYIHTYQHRYIFPNVATRFNDLVPRRRKKEEKKVYQKFKKSKYVWRFKNMRISSESRKEMVCIDTFFGPLRGRGLRNQGVYEGLHVRMSMCTYACVCARTHVHVCMFVYTYKSLHVSLRTYTYVRYACIVCILRLVWTVCIHVCKVYIPI